MDSKSKRYDRQLRLWQSHGQMKLEESSICLLNASSLGTEILKNLVLPGIGSFTIVDGESGDDVSDFFMQTGQKNKSKAEVCLPFLLELNEEVGAFAVNSSPAHMIKNEIDFFKKFNIIIATNLEEEVLFKLADFCFNNEIPLVIVRICGFYGYLRLIIPELCGNYFRELNIVIETHPEQMFDLRLDQPFKELQEYIDDFSFENFDAEAYSHVPFGVILLKVLNEWKKEHGKLPSSRDEKNDFKAQITRLKQNSNDSENFDEALSFSYRAWTPTKIPSQIIKLTEDVKMKNLDRKSKPFWIMVKALSDFIQLHGVLPLSGVIPDMKADTESFIELQKLYHSKALLDIEWMKSRVFQICDTLGIPSDNIPADLIERFCKNSASLSVFRTSSLNQEYSNSVEKSKLYSSYLSESDNHLVYYLMFRAIDKFKALHHRYPGDHDSNVDSDVGSLRKCLNGILLDYGISSCLISDDYVQEMYFIFTYCSVRAGGSHLPCMAGIMGGIASQEVIKLLTKQYIPLNNTLIFNGIASSSAVFEL